MPNIQTANAAAKVDVAFALDVPNFGVFRPICNECLRKGYRTCNSVIAVCFNVLIGPLGITLSLFPCQDITRSAR